MMNHTTHWVALSNDGSVAVAHCNCMAGLAESCSHIAALLFKVEATVRLGYTTQLCTELPCKWNADFVKKVQPAPVKDINFYKTSCGNKAKKIKMQHSQSTQEEQQTLLHSLSACNSKPVVLSTFDEFSDKFHWQKRVNVDPLVPRSVRSLYNSEFTKLKHSDLHAIGLEKVDSYSISDDTIRYIYDITKTQSSSMTWHEQRIGRITSSVVHNVLHTDQSNPASSLLKSICNPKSGSLDHVPAIKWGKENEEVALKEYALTMRTQHQDFDRRSTGFLISEKYPFIGVSADSVASCSCHGERIVEVKCPFSHKDSTLQEYTKDSSSCIAENGRGVKPSHKYYSQMLQMFVHDVRICNFVLYTSKMTAIFYVPRNDDFISDMINKIKDFHICHVMPELLTRRLENKTPDVKQNNLRLYCYCGSLDDGKAQMIGCDKPECKIQWFHLKCLKMKRVPKGKWICKDCKKQ